jgi:hypothetical protein
MEAREEMLCYNDTVTIVGAKKLIFVQERVLRHLLTFPPHSSSTMKTSFSRAMKNYLVKNNYHSTTQDVR